MTLATDKERKHNHTHLHLILVTLGLLSPEQVIIRLHLKALYIETAHFLLPPSLEWELMFYCQTCAEWMSDAFQKSNIIIPTSSLSVD